MDFDTKTVNYQILKSVFFADSLTLGYIITV
jgi:hypothetical protein